MGGTQLDETLPSPASEPGEPATSRALAIDTRIGDRYRIVRLIGVGGMGEVYAAEDHVLGETIALKTLRSELAGSTVARERFRRELALARRVSHPNVCRLHDVGEHAGRVFLTMELLAGPTLADRLRAEGPLALDTLARIAEQLVDGLGALHAAGVVHRDFKSANVMLIGERTVITDFGLARSLVDHDALLTGEVGLLGTPAYMAPEQVHGRAATIASDVYALGVVLFEVATGALPFREDTALATATARLERDPPRPSTLRSELAGRWEGVILRCLAREPARRFASMTEVRAALAGELASPTASRRTRIIVAVAGVAAGALAVSAFVLRSSDPPASDPACPAATARLAGIWDPATRAQIEARFATGAPFVQAAWRGHAQQFDAHAAAWSERWDASCASGERTSDALLHGQRVACLDARRIELRGFISGLADPAITVEDFALGSPGTFPLTPVDECDRPAVLRAQMPAPTGATRERVDALMAEYHAVRVQLRAASNGGLRIDVGKALGRLGELTGELRSLGYLAGAVEVGRWHAHHLASLRRRQDADDIVARTIALAEEARDDLQLGRALAQQVEHRARDMPAYDDAAAERTLTRAVQVANRVGSPPSLLEAIASARFEHAVRTGRYHDAVRANRELVELHRHLGYSSFALWRRKALALLRSWNGDAQVAVAEADAILRDREALGADHVQLAHDLMDLSDVLAVAGDPRGALAMCTRAIEALTRARGGRPSAHLADAQARAFIHATSARDDAAAARHLDAAVVELVARHAISRAAAYGRLSVQARLLGSVAAAQLALTTARDARGTPEELARIAEAEADLAIEADLPLADVDWAARLAKLPELNRAVTLAVVAARRRDAAAALAHLSALPAADQHFARGMVLFELGRFAEAVPGLRVDFDIANTIDGWDDTGRTDLAGRLGIAMLEAGDAAGSIAHLEHALWRMGQQTLARSAAAQDVRFALARALSATGGDRSHARALATEAERRLRTIGPSLSARADRVAAWIRTTFPP